MKRVSVLPLFALLALVISAITMLPITRVSGEQVVMTYEVYATEDAYVDERGSYRDTNYGSAPILEVASSPEGNQRAYIKFDVSELPYGSVRSAKLVLNATKTPLAVRTYEAYAVWGPWDTPSWNESGITWNNAPWWMDMLGTADVGGINSTGLVGWDVKEAVKMWINRWWPNNGLLIRDRNEWSPARFVTEFKSREAGTPKLVVEIVVSPTFEISVWPPRQSSPIGSVTEWWVNIRSVNSWSGTINLTITNLEAFGGSAEFEKSTVNLGSYGDIVVKLRITAGVARKGSYTFYVNGTSGGEFSTDSGILDIVPAPILRELPDSISPNMPYSVGTPINVTMRYNPGSIEGFQDGNPTGIIVKERLSWYLRFIEDLTNPKPPMKVRLDNKSTPDPYDDETELVWMFAQDFQGVDLTASFTWTYQVNFTAPEGTEPWRIPNELQWWGDWQASDSSGMTMGGQILGDNRVKMEFGLPGPWDDDGFVDDNELLQAIVYWKQGSMTDEQLLSYIQLWVNAVPKGP